MVVAIGRLLPERRAICVWCLNLEKIVPSPYFRTYWVQQNITDLAQYSAAVSDLFRSNQQYREERVLIPQGSAGSSIVRRRACSHRRPGSPRSR